MTAGPTPGAASVPPASLPPASGPPALPRTEIERVFRDEHGRSVAVLVRLFGDIDIAEEAVQDAFAAAAARWPDTGLPPSPAGWIITTARNRALDRLRRESSRDDRHTEAAQLYTRTEGTRARRARCTTTDCA
jgi:RNA polymerase sigma-70 factor (ECF subfamily)